MGILKRARQWLTTTLVAPPTEVGSLKAFEDWMDSWGISKSGAGVDVTVERALQVDTVHACIKVLAESIASLPLKVYSRVDGERAEDDAHPLNAVLRYAPNDEQTPFEFFETMVGHLCTRGKFYAQKVVNGMGRVTQLVPLDPDKVERVRLNANGGVDPEGDLFFLYRQGPGDVVPLAAQDVFRVQNFLGLSPIALAKNSIGAVAAQDDFAAEFFANGVRPSGIINHPEELSENARKNIMESWRRLHSGTGNRHKLILLEEGMTWNQLSITNEEAQFLETRRYGKEQICAIFRVPPHMVADLQRATFSNIEHQDLEFAKHTLRPLLVRVEQAMQRDLFSEEERGRAFAEFNVDGLLRGDYKTRQEGHSAAIAGGHMTPNEARKLENLPPKEGGDRLLVPLNYGVLMEDGTVYVPSNENGEGGEEIEEEDFGA